MKKVFSIFIIVTMVISNLAFCSQYAFADNVSDYTISLGWHHSAAIREDGSLWMWGDNEHGQLGNGTETDSTTPIKIMDNVKSVSLGGWHSAAIRTDGSLWMWGYNYNGRLGNGTTVDSTTPIKIMDNVKSVSLGDYHSAAIRTDGSLWMWGDNEDGQLGNGTTVDSTTPIKIMDNVKSVSLGGWHSAAIRTDGSLWMWGSNFFGRLGNGTIVDSATPIKIMDNVKSVSLGSNHSAAIREDGSLWMWGNNYHGQLGNGTTVDSTTPIKIMDNVKSVSLGWRHSAAIRADGSLWMWGYNWYGQLGNGTETDSTTPIKIMDNVKSVSLGGWHSAAIRTDGSLWMWGDNYYGQLGNGTTVDSTTPIKIMDNVMLPGDSSVQQLAGLSIPSAMSVNIADLPQTLYVYGESNVDFRTDDSSIIDLQPAPLLQLGAKQAVSAVWVTGKSPGTATITATTPDGRSAQCVVTVSGQVAETISDEMILKAKICANNSDYHLMRDSFVSPASALVDDSGKVWSELYQDINDFLDFCSLSYTATDYYEVALMDMLSRDNKYYEIAKDIVDNEFVKKLVDQANEKLHDNLNANKVHVSGLNCFDIDEFYSDVSFLDAILAGKDVADSMYQKFEQIYVLSMVTDEQIKMLRMIKNSTLNQELKDACDTVIKTQAESAQKTAEEIAYNTAFAGIEELGSYVVKRGWDGLAMLIPGMKEAKLIVEGGKLVSNGLYNADALSADILTMAATTEISETLKACMKNEEKRFLKNPTSKNALNFMAAANSYKAVCLYSCDAAIEFSNDLEYAQNAQKAFETSVKIFANPFFVSLSDLNNVLSEKCNAENIVEFKKSVESIKRMVNKMDFYNPRGDDIAQYIRTVVSTTPSEWAKPYIDKAVNYNLLQDEYQNNYQNNITRAEFCTLLTYLIDSKTDESIDEIATRLGRPQITVMFDDALYAYVSDIAKLGIINGTGNNKFEPLGEITREQAAKMLCETAKVLGYDTSAMQSNLSSVSDWAKEGVNFVLDRGIMTGTDKGFEPQGTYTKEQAITTFVRFYELIK